MGFLDNLFKKEARKIISGAVDNAVDSIMNSVKQSVRGDGSDAEDSSRRPAVNSGGRCRENDTGGDEDCCYDEDIVRRRVEAVAAEDWPSYELRRDIPATELGADEKAHGFDYGLYLDGQPKVMIMILDQYQYRTKSVQRAHAACKDKGVGSFHLLMHLPNHKTYIGERVRAVMPS